MTRALQVVGTTGKLALGVILTIQTPGDYSDRTIVVNYTYNTSLSLNCTGLIVQVPVGNTVLSTVTFNNCSFRITGSAGATVQCGAFSGYYSGMISTVPVTSTGAITMEACTASITGLSGATMMLRQTHCIVLTNDLTLTSDCTLYSSRLVKTAAAFTCNAFSLYESVYEGASAPSLSTGAWNIYNSNINLRYHTTVTVTGVINNYGGYITLYDAQQFTCTSYIYNYCGTIMMRSVTELWLGSTITAGASNPLLKTNGGGWIDFGTTARTVKLYAGTWHASTPTIALTCYYGGQIVTGSNQTWQDGTGASQTTPTVQRINT